MEHDDNTIKLLREMYRKKLPEKIEDIESQWYAIRRSWDKVKMEAFTKAVHKFNGSAGSYGFTEISQILNELETYLRELGKNDGPITPDQEGRIEMMVIRTKETIAGILSMDFQV